MKPATAVTNKHLLPIYSDQGAVPMIFYPIGTLVSSGIDEILIVSSREHSGSIIQNLGDGSEFGVDFTYKVQDPSRVGMGIASALRLSEGFTGDDNFAVILGDNFYEDCFKEHFLSFCSSGMSSMLFVKRVEDPERFGVYFDGHIEEKPSNPKSNMAVTGLYLYTKEVYKVAKTLSPSGRGELEISDVNDFYCRSARATVMEIHGFWSDMGTPQSARKTQAFLNGSA